ncbi:MAG: dienelactone hydrolase family protein [Pseudomonadota bacterium]
MTSSSRLPTRRALLGLPFVAGGLAACTAHTPKLTPTTMTANAPLAAQADLQLHLKATLRHWVDLPAGYAEAPDRRWPLIVFLHGSGERGHDLAAVRIHGLPKHLDAGERAPAIVVSPQCEPDFDWDPHLLHALLIDLKARWRIDERRVTATGLSMGGAGCWDWAMQYPDDLAGIAPVCGFGRWLRIKRMRAVPVRAYHGLDDTVVPPQASRDLVDALRAAGGQAELTLYPGVGHDAWNPAYADPALLPWLLARQRA